MWNFPKPPITVGNEPFWIFFWGISFSVSGDATGSTEIHRKSTEGRNHQLKTGKSHMTSDSSLSLGEGSNEDFKSSTQSEKEQNFRLTEKMDLHSISGMGGVLSNTQELGAIGHRSQTPTDPIVVPNAHFSRSSVS